MRLGQPSLGCRVCTTTTGSSVCLGERLQLHLIRGSACKSPEVYCCCPSFSGTLDEQVPARNMGPMPSGGTTPAGMFGAYVTSNSQHQQTSASAPVVQPCLTIMDWTVPKMPKKGWGAMMFRVCFRPGYMDLGDNLRSLQGAPARSLWRSLVAFCRWRWFGLQNPYIRSNKSKHTSFTCMHIVTLYTEYLYIYIYICMYN